MPKKNDNTALIAIGAVAAAGIGFVLLTGRREAGEEPLEVPEFPEAPKEEKPEVSNLGFLYAKVE